MHKSENDWAQLGQISRDSIARSARNRSEEEYEGMWRGYFFVSNLVICI